MHHKLRRDPNWHPNGCNLCGQVRHAYLLVLRLVIWGIVAETMRPREKRKTSPPPCRRRSKKNPSTFSFLPSKKKKKPKKQLGHQASVCPNGTVDWRDKFGGEEGWKGHFVATAAVLASEDPSCSFGNGRRQAEAAGAAAGAAGGGGGGAGQGQRGLRAARTPARVAAQDPAAVEEAARAWAKRRKEGGAAEREPVPPARRGPRRQAPPAAPAPGFPGAPLPAPHMSMAMMPPPPMPGGFYPAPQQQQGFYGGQPPPMMMMRPPPPQQQQQQWQQQPQHPPAALAQPAPPPPKPSRPAAPGSPPPAGWGKAVDSKGRTYYWNRKDKSKVSWKKPAAE